MKKLLLLSVFSFFGFALSSCHQDDGVIEDSNISTKKKYHIWKCFLHKPPMVIKKTTKQLDKYDYGTCNRRGYDSNGYAQSHLWIYQGFL